MNRQDEKNKNLMNFIKRVHGLVENADIEKHRHSQDYIGTILGNTKEIVYREFHVGNVEAEWISVNHVHMKKQVILYCHGGGYSTGSSKYARTLTSKLAMGTSLDVLSFDYRLAPEHPYPAALEDALKVWDYLMLQGYAARDIFIAGDSAGGNLALTLTLKLKAEGRFLPGGLILLSPWTDLTSSGESFETKAALDPVLDTAYIDRMRYAYAGSRNLKNPMISPLYGDFEGFPPACIQVGTNEILLSDSVRLCQRMKEAGVAVRLEQFEGMWHVFQMSPFKTAAQAMDKIVEFVYENI